MASSTRRTLLRLSAAAPLAASIGTLRAEDSPPKRFSPPVPSRERKHYFPNVTLTTHEGKTVKFYDDLIKGKIVTINMFYAQCDEICPLVTSNLVKVQRLLGHRVGRDIFMYSLTLKPEEDTPAVIREFRAMHGVKPGWTFLTGAPADVELLRRKLGFTYSDPQIDQDKTQHIGNLRYGNEPLALWAACPGMADPAWIVESLSWVDRGRLPRRLNGRQG